MKTALIASIAILLSSATLCAHERITIGPNGGRVIYLDSTTTPNVEFLVRKDGRAEVTLLDKDRKPIQPGEQTLTVTAGPRTSAKKLAIEKAGGSFVTETVPAGAPYTVVMQLKETPAAKAQTIRLNYDPTRTKEGKPQYLDDSVNEGSGPSITIPQNLDELFAEINQHHAELKENIKEKKYEPLDEVTQAFPVLLKALPGKSGDKESAVKPQVDALLKELAAIASANAERKLGAAGKSLESFNAGLAALKKNYPEKTANAKL